MPSDDPRRYYYENKQKKPITCKYCGETGHNKAGCSTFKSNVQSYKAVNDSFRKDVAQYFDNSSIIPGNIFDITTQIHINNFWLSHPITRYLGEYVGYPVEKQSQTVITYTTVWQITEVLYSNIDLVKNVHRNGVVSNFQAKLLTISLNEDNDFFNFLKNNCPDQYDTIYQLIVKNITYYNYSFRNNVYYNDFYFVLSETLYNKYFITDGYNSSYDSYLKTVQRYRNPNAITTDSIDNLGIKANTNFANIPELTVIDYRNNKKVFEDSETFRRFRDYVKNN